jgi:hypothetical protein
MMLFLGEKRFFFVEIVYLTNRLQHRERCLINKNLGGEDHDGGDD